MTIELYNTLSRKKEAFTPLSEGKVKMYSCGPTVYHYAHIGNLRGYVFTDIVRRMFLSAGYKVEAVINITDVGHIVDDADSGEDKMEKGSRREGKSAYDIAEFYTKAYFNDLTALNIPLSSYSFPRATDTIKEQIEMVKTLEEKGYTYETSDGIYFDTSLFKAYGDLAQIDVEGLRAGARIGENEEKKNVTDFALWKFSPKGERRQMEWESPWGIGFPGWHIECSAMSKKLLGNHFDIHMGGIDHIPVHHSNEIAQSECTNGEKFVNYWLHYNHLHDENGKMAKSRDDFLRLATIVEKRYSPLHYRYYLLLAHYRSEISFSFTALSAARTAYKKLRLIYSESKKKAHRVDVPKELLAPFFEALYDDVNTPRAIASMWSFIAGESHPSLVYSYLKVVSEVLGLALEKEEVFTISEDVAQLVRERESARLQKNWAESDRLRDVILEKGFVVKDGPKGQMLERLLD